MTEKSELKKVVKTHFTTGNAVQMWEDVYRDNKDFFSYAMSARKAAVLDIFREDDPRQAPQVADIGCGSGLVSKELLALGFDVTGLDISEGMLENARKIPGLKLTVGDVEHLPFPDASFDRIICLGVITYLPNEMKALAELHRILKPGGRLVLAVRNKLEAAVLLDVVGKISKLFRWAYRAIVPAQPKPGKAAYYHRNFVPWRLRSNLQRTGFAIDRTLGRGFDYPQVMSRRITSLAAGLRFSRFVEQLSDKSLCGFLRNWGLVYILVARKQD